MSQLIEIECIYFIFNLSPLQYNFNCGRKRVCKRTPKKARKLSSSKRLSKTVSTSISDLAFPSLFKNLFSFQYKRLDEHFIILFVPGLVKLFLRWRFDPRINRNNGSIQREITDQAWGRSSVGVGQLAGRPHLHWRYHFGTLFGHRLTVSALKNNLRCNLKIF